MLHMGSQDSLDILSLENYKRKKHILNLKKCRDHLDRQAQNDDSAGGHRQAEVHDVHHVLEPDDHSHGHLLGSTVIIVRFHLFKRETY